MINTYLVGGTFSYKGTEVSATYDDGYTGIINSYTFDTEQGTTLTQEGVHEFTVSFGNLTASFTVNVVTVPVLEYLTYTISNDLIDVKALNTSKLVADNLASIEIPSKITVGNHTYKIRIAN